MSIYAIIIIIFLFLLLSTNRYAFRYLPFIIFFGILIYFFGWFFMNFFWVIPLYWIYKVLAAPKTTARTRTRTYRTYTNQEAEEFFRDFFRQAGGQYSNQSGQQGYGNYNSGYQGGYTQNTYVDKSKYYKILGVSENCTKEELRKAYLKKVKEHHPDRFVNASETEKKYHEDNLKKINEAYDNLNKDFS